MTELASLEDRVENDAPAARTKRAKGPSAVRIIFAGLIAVMLAVGFTVAGNAPMAEAKAKYVTKKYQKARYGDTSRKVRNVQLRLADVGELKKKYVTGYYGDITRDAVKDFRRSVGMKAGNGKKVTKKTWRKLVKKSGKVRLPGGGGGSEDDGSKTNLPKRCLTGGRVLCISKNSNTLYYVNNNKIQKKLDARFGCANSPTRNGTWTLFRKVRHEISYEYGSKMPYSMYFSGGQAVHYSSDFAARGYNGCSHGCVNIRNKKALRSIYNKMKVGDRIVVFG